MKKISVGICDDGKELCCEIEQFILAYGRKQNLALDCFVWYSGEELCDDLKQGIHIDILFLDIALMEMDGVDCIYIGIPGLCSEFVSKSAHGFYTKTY